MTADIAVLPGAATPDPATPVLVGVGQVVDRLDDPFYRALSPVALAAEAALAALADTGAEVALVARAVDVVAGVRHFEDSTPWPTARFGRADNYPMAVARRVGAEPVRAILDIAGGQSPQHLVTELAATIASGAASAALAFGSEAISTIRHLAGAEDRPDFTEQVGGPLEDRGPGLVGITSLHLSAHSLSDAASQYALFDNARRTRLGLSRAAYADAIGELFAPFSAAAAGNPFAAAPVARSAAELMTVTPQNRMIADPYTRYVVARDQVNQGAAVLITSIAMARRLGIDESHWVYLHGHADVREKPTLHRPDLSRSPAAVRASEHALRMAGIGMDDVATIDLYSCFAAPVFNLTDAFGLSVDDPRGLTLTGGLPFFGGAGNNYSMHAIAETVARARRTPGSYGFVGANGGTMSKYSVGVYSTAPASWRVGDSAGLQAELDAVPGVEAVRRPDGPATIETYTVRHGKDGRRTGIILGRLVGDGRRFVARTARGADDLLELLAGGEPVGVPVLATARAEGNAIVASRAQLTQLFPPATPTLRESYEHVLVRRDGHLLEVTINRPDVLNALHPAANAELDQIFDAYFADPDLWVAILTGAGDRAFCTGNDLVHTARGGHGAVPLNGFAGLTGRAELPKPVIAAINGYAMGGGFEIALACHLAVADSRAQFALSEVQVGLVAGAGGLVRLPRTVPAKIAHELILTGRRIDAEQAERWGLVNRVVEPGIAVDAARELAGLLLTGSPTSIRYSLAAMARAQAIPDTAAGVHAPAELFEDLMLTEDAAEGPRAFAAKRPPQWRNR